MRKWLCIVCGWIYDEAKGWPSDGISPGTKWEDIPEDWMCPECNVGKSDFEMLDITDIDLEENQLCDAIKSLEPVVIIGSGHAGYHVAASLRSQSPNLSITVFTSDDGALYSKPSISNALALKKDGYSLIREHALDWENRLNIRLYPNTEVKRIDRSNKKIQTTIGEYPYGKLVIATGAKPIIVPIEGDVSGVVSVNNLADYRAFRQKISNKQHITILGDGLIGCEFANDLAASGIKVTVVGLGKWVMERLIPEPVAVTLQRALKEIGVEWKLENSISSINSINGRYYLQLIDGQSLETDIVLSAVGLKPNIQLAQEAGLKTMNGICTGLDHRTSDPAIFAIGDCAEVDGHWAPYISPITQAIPSLVNNLLDQPTEVSITSSPIIVKTPILPLTILPGSEPGQWVTEEYEGDLAAGHYNSEGKLTGFSLLGHQLQQRRMEWMSKLSP